MKERSGHLTWALYASGTANPSAWATASTAEKSATGPSAPALNTWTHMAATYDGSTLRLYVNGTQVASAPQTAPLATSTQRPAPRRHSIWVEWFAGRLDDIRIYNTALTNTQIQTDMNTPAA